MSGTLSTTLALHPRPRKRSADTPTPPLPPTPLSPLRPQPPATTSAVADVHHANDDDYIRWGEAVSYPNRRITVTRKAKSANPYGGAQPGPNEAKRRTAEYKAFLSLPPTYNASENQGLRYTSEENTAGGRPQYHGTRLGLQTLVPWRPNLNHLQRPCNWIGPLLLQRPFLGISANPAAATILGAKSNEFLELSLPFPMTSFGSENQRITVIPRDPTPK